MGTVTSNDNVQSKFFYDRMMMISAMEKERRLILLRDEIRRIVEVIEIQKVDGRPRSPSFQRQQENQRLRLEEIKLELLQLIPKNALPAVSLAQSEPT